MGMKSGSSASRHFSFTRRMAAWRLRSSFCGMKRVRQGGKSWKKVPVSRKLPGEPKARADMVCETFQDMNVSGMRSSSPLATAKQKWRPTVVLFTILGPGIDSNVIHFRYAFSISIISFMLIS